MNTISDDDLRKLVLELAETLLALKLKIACAESCTGGWLAKCCTDVAGSSIWFDRGFITYSNQAKQDMLSVSLNTLEDFGAVSEQTAREMALGAIDYSSADLAVSITGIAGPDGGSLEKPVGTVCFAWANRKGDVQAVSYQFSGNRETVRRQAVSTAIKGFIKNARDSSLSMG